MVTFADLVVAHWFGFTAPNIPESVQNSLLNIAMVGLPFTDIFGAVIRLVGTKAIVPNTLFKTRRQTPSFC